ncbi:MAG: NADH-quinone oxidoreductase subunit NuoF [Chloroflexi bacterium]|nr:NADH-quinone oxidoreductase subunit NuoF [Chloroflexota bacterium]
MGQLKSPSELEKARQDILAKIDPNKPCITICSGTGCCAYGSEKVFASFEEVLKSKGLEGSMALKRTGCHGFCERGTLVVIHPEETCYIQVQLEDVDEIISSVREGKIIERLLYVDPVTGEKITRESEIPFYKNQNRLIFGDNRHIDPKSIEDYLALGGYGALAKALHEMNPEQVLEEVKESNLRGRGGGGFPAGRKWETVRNAPGEPKYIIVNCDEGDPGAYMDRSLMEGNPHSVLEGLVIAAYAIGSHDGFIYIRNEYPLAVENVNIAIAQAKEYGLVGEEILGSGFSFNVEINRGGGAFVCGESTALMASLEGEVGEPRAKYIHTAESGLWGKPSDLNNVETFANVPFIISRGADWYKQIGTEGSKGTKIFSLVGKVNNTGLVEVPMGTTLRTIIYDIGGGIRDGKSFKAVQTGGPSGGVIPEAHLNLSIDFDELAKVGSMMGSGGMIVMDDSTCMVDIAKYFTSFLEGESCGKCVPCREGLLRMRQILEKISDGKGLAGDIEMLDHLASVMKDSALCALGQTAPNPVLSTIRYFRDEYEAHINKKKCPAKVCKALITYSIVEANCPGCGLCVKNCPQGAIESMGKKQPVVMHQEKCIKCGICYDVCKLNAVEVG